MFSFNQRSQPQSQLRQKPVKVKPFDNLNLEDDQAEDFPVHDQSIPVLKVSPKSSKQQDSRKHKIESQKLR